MRRRPALLLGALLAPALPLLVAGPAHAAGIYCVSMPTGTACDQTFTTLHDAVAAAASGTTIKVGPGTYSDGPYVLAPGAGIQGSASGGGASATVLTLGAGSQTYLTADGGTVTNLRVSMSNGTGATAIAAGNGSVVADVVVLGRGSPGSTGLRAQGSATVSRVTVDDADTAVRVEGGSLAIDDSVLDLGAAGTTGLLAQPSTGQAGVTAAFLTVVGGAAGSRGVVVAPTGSATATVTLTSSIVRGPTTSLVRGAGTASLSVSRSAYQTTQGGVTDGGGNLPGVDPGFVEPAAGNYDLRAGSAVIDKGTATALGLDRAGRTRSFDGNGDGVAAPDMGAYELHDVTPPKTVITGGPSGPTSDNTPVFTFRSGPRVTFACELDGTVFPHCTSPVTTTPLPDGPHTFSVRATDAVLNVEADPPRRTFTVDTKAPDSAFTKTPPKRFYKPRMKFRFSSTEPGVRFQCKPDNLPWRSCRSPFHWTVTLGKHRLAVRAVDAAGNQDPSPARCSFKRIPRPKHHHHHHHHHR